MARHSHFCRAALLTTFGALLWLPLPAQEVVVGWHDHMYLQPGDGVQLNRQQEPVFPGLLVMSSPGMTTGNTGDQQTYVTFAQHTYDMVKTLSVNSSVGLSSLVFDGNIDVSFFGRQTFNGNDLTFV